MSGPIMPGGAKPPRTVAILTVMTILTSSPGAALPQTSTKVTAPRIIGADHPQELAAWVRDFVQAQTQGAQPPSLAIVVVKDGETYFEGGTNDVDAKHTIFRAASVSKLFVATAVMQLAERGALDLHADVNRYLKRLQLEATFPAPITLHHLLTHTSGIEDRLFGYTLPSTHAPVSLGDYFAAHVPRRIRPPGEQIAYSNVGMALAGHIVEEVSGLSFEDYVERYIFGPLGMSRSSFRQPYPRELAADVVPSGADDVKILPYPSGSLISTAADMGRFIKAHLQDGTGNHPQLLSPASRKAMHQRQFAAHPAIPGVAYGFFEHYANGQRLLCHTGAGGHQSLLCLLPEHNVGLYVVLSTRQGGPHQEFRRKFLNAFLDHWYPEPPFSAKQRAGGEDQFTRVYRPNLFPKTTIEKLANLGADTRVVLGRDGTLRVDLPPFGSTSVRASPIQPGVFQSDDDLYFAFDRNGSRLEMSGGLADPVTFERLRWYQRGTVHAAAALAGLGLFASCCLAVLGGWGMRRIRRQQSSPSRGALRFAWLAALMVSVLALLGPLLGAAYLFLGDPGERPFKIATALTICVALWHFAALLGLSLPYFAVLAWRSGEWPRPWCIYYGAIALAGVLLLPFFAYWNILGFRF